MSAVDYSTFNYLTATNAGLYRAIMLQFLRAKNRFVVHLRPEEVLAGLDRPADLAEVSAALTSLSGWGNLSADPDTTRVTTVEDFHRARFLYQMSVAGEAAERALRQFDESLGHTGSLQAAALVDIAGDLRALVELVAAGEPDAGKTHPLLLRLATRFAGLADNAQAFVGSLQRAIDLNGVNADAFLAYKDRLIEYLQRFVGDLVTTGSEIARLIERLDEAGVEPLLRAAAEREAADDAPDLDPDAPDGEVTVGSDVVGLRLADRRLAEWRERWLGFRQWFISEPGHDSQQKLLRNRARAAVPQLLQVVRSLNERRSGRSDRSTDLTALAIWFAEAADEGEMHRLWRAAFGLSAARHLSIDQETLEQREAHPVSASTSWFDAPALRISPRLRATGSYERTGKPATVIDRSAGRRHLAELAGRERAELAAAKARLVTDGELLLSELDTLDAGSFELFLRLVGDALADRRPDETTATLTARSIDGSLELRMTPVLDSGLVAVRTAFGTLRGPEHRIEILDTLGSVA